MPIRMIVTDLDGTLLRTDKTVSLYTKMVFNKCREQGIKIVFATARPIRTVVGMKLGIEPDAAIYHNGAVLSIDGKPHRHIGIEPKAVKLLLHQASRSFSDMQMSVEIDDVLYANFDVTETWSETAFTMTDFTDLPKKPADKIIFVTAEKEKVKAINELLPDNLYSEITENSLLMIMNKDARKCNAVKEVADHFGIPFTQVAVFGDDYNDVEMIREYGIGVAVANAIDEAKAVAGHICESNDNDGVAKWLEANVLI